MTDNEIKPYLIHEGLEPVTDFVVIYRALELARSRPELTLQGIANELHTTLEESYLRNNPKGGN
jgi:hypothetical protein